MLIGCAMCPVALPSPSITCCHVQRARHRGIPKTRGPASPTGAVRLRGDRVAIRSTSSLGKRPRLERRHQTIRLRDRHWNPASSPVSGDGDQVLMNETPPFAAFRAQPDGRRDSNLCILESDSPRLSAPGGGTRTCASRIKGAPDRRLKPVEAGWASEEHERVARESELTRA